MVNKQFSEKISAFWMITLTVVLAAILSVVMVASANAFTDVTRPTIISVSPTNNMLDLSRNEQVTVVFSEDMDPSTINTNTFIVMRRTTPESGAYRSIAVPGTVIYDEGRTAIFTPSTLLSSGQQYGNVFTVTITNGAKDLSGNSISRDYVWSFTTGNNPFNTGATTSKSDQSAIPVTGLVTAPAVVQPISPVVAPVTNTQTANTNNLSWIWWVVAGAFLLLLFVLVLSSSINRTPQRNSRVTRPNPFGDVHPVIAIEGIGPKYNKELHAMGIKNTKQLWEADTAKVAQKIGAPLSSVRSWQQMAELASVKDIGPQYAELLERSGVHSIGQLQSYEPNKLLRMVNEKQDSLKINIQGNSPGHATVEHWIEEARDHKFTDPAVGQIA
jgi:predicted flap endonuclease-1-like 5' DNA nuclease